MLKVRADQDWKFKQKCAAVLHPKLRENKALENFRDLNEDGNALGRFAVAAFAATLLSFSLGKAISDTTLSKGSALSETEHVSGTGSYQTTFEIPVPPSPGAPKLALVYNSQTNASLAGTGWDLSVGYPMSIMRDVRFGTPQWSWDANWLWGSTPLVRLNPSSCGEICQYRTAPESLASVAIDLSPPPFPESGVVAQPPHERATVRLPNGTTLDYEPIYYDSADYPAPPAGAKTPVFGFRLASIADRNGYLTCFRYRIPQNQQQTDAQRQRGRVAPLAEIAYGLPPSSAATCANLFTRADRHSVRFDYQTATDRGYYSTWTLRFGAPVTFDDLLTQISIYPRSVQRTQDEFLLTYFPSNASDTHRPLLQQIIARVPVGGAFSGATSTRIAKAFSYGKRSTQFTYSDVIDLGPVASLPKSLAGSVTRPVRRASLLQNPNGIFQPGQDQDTDAAPPTHAVTEQWAFLDFNGDGLPDLQWGRESGFAKDSSGNDAPWATFEAAPPPFSGTVTLANRPAQQKILINHGVTAIAAPTTFNRTLATSPLEIKSSAPQLEGNYFPQPTPRLEDGSRNRTSWIWIEGRGLTRTGMPVSAGGGEAPGGAGSCPRRWPVYPDNTIPVPESSVLYRLKEKSAINSNSVLAGNAFVGDIVNGIYDGYRPTFAASATLSTWADMDGDGLPEFVATPAWIDRFAFDFSCPTHGLDPSAGIPSFPYTQDASLADDLEPAGDFLGVETDWYYRGSSTSLDGAPAACASLSAGTACLTETPGPAGPVGLPISFETSTGNSEGFGLTLPIGAIYSAVLSAVISESWIPLAAAGPTVTVTTHAPRAAGGVRVSVPGPSAAEFSKELGESVSGMLQNLGSAAAADAGAGAFGFLATIAKVDLDFTLLSATTQNRSESRSQLMDINADGLPDYLLYSNGNNITVSPSVCGPGTTAEGKVIAYLNSPAGFGQPGSGPLVINCGYDYPVGLSALSPATLATIDARIDEIENLVNELVFPLDVPGPEDPLCSGTEGMAFCTAYAALTPVPPDQLCKSQAALLVSCIAYAVKIGLIADKAEQVINLAQPLMNATIDAIPRERSLISEAAALKDFLRGFGLSIQLHPDIASVDGTTAVARTVADNLDYVARSLRHINHSSRINVVTQGFSRLGGNQPVAGSDDFQPFWEAVFGITAQTKGYVDINGDALPDYVLTEDRDPMGTTGSCPVGSWKVFWGTGTSSITAGRAFLPTPECIAVPVAPTAVTNYGYATLPISVDLVRRDGTNGSKIDAVSQSFVSLADMNSDGRPDIIVAADSWNSYSDSETWKVYLNNGRGFDLSDVNRLDIASPRRDNNSWLEPASCKSPDLVRGCLDEPLHIPFPSIRTTQSDSVNFPVRDKAETQAAMIDIDGDGTPEMVRRVVIRSDSDRQYWREGLLAWRRPSIGGPQDLMIEERDPVEGRRILVEYRPAADFQWADATPNGAAPQLGHSNLAGVSGHLVRSVTTERLLGMAQKRTRRGYDYKLPYFDQGIRVSGGFALRSSFALDPLPEDPALAVPIAESIVQSSRSSQGADAVSGTTHQRLTVRATGAPVLETLTSLAVSLPTSKCPGSGSARADPTASCPALGGIRPVFSAPNRILSVEYPDGLTQGPIFELGFDGRKPWVDRVTGAEPLPPQGQCSEFAEFLAGAAQAGEATGGAAAFAALPVLCNQQTSSSVVSGVIYRSPHPAAPATVDEVTIEAWVKPPASQPIEQVIVEQPGAYQLLVVSDASGGHWQMKIANGLIVTSSAPADFVADQWHHVVATFGSGEARILVNGRLVGSATGPQSSPQANGSLSVGCGLTTGGMPERCFEGVLGELRLYPEFWSTAPRVTDLETRISLQTCQFDAGACPHDFGQARTVWNRNDLAVAGDDVGSDYEYAQTQTGAAGSQIYGLISTEANWAPRPDGSPAEYLSFSAHWYDGQTNGLATIGNETKLARFDGLAQLPRPTPGSLQVTKQTSYDTSCPGRVSETVDPLGFSTRTTWDETCTFPLTVTNAAGHVSRTRYYGVSDSLSAPLGGTRTGPFGTFVLAGHYGQTAATIDPNDAATVSTYDEWGRPLATWSPLDRPDRPGIRSAYREAICEKFSHAIPTGTGELEFIEVFEATGCERPGTRLKSPSRVTLQTWDDQLARCSTAAGRTVHCVNEASAKFADEQPPGDYRASYLFADGQTHRQSVNSGRPAWWISGVDDHDGLGRLRRAHRVQFLPSGCPKAGEWCNGVRMDPDPLRDEVAAVQFAYDARSREIRTYGSRWPKCPGDPSAINANGELACDFAATKPPINDVTRTKYPSPGDVETTDGKGVPSLVHRDVRGLTTFIQEYVLSPNPTAYSAVTLSYDRLARLVSTTDQNNNVSLRTYDALSRMTSSTDPDLGLTTYQYDRRSQLIDRTVATGERARFTYDPVGRVAQTDYLRPRSIVSPSTSTLTPSFPNDPGYRPPPDLDRFACREFEEFFEPTRFAGVPGAIDPPDIGLKPIAGSGERLRLPFDVVLRASPRSERVRGGLSRSAPIEYRFSQGSSVSVDEDGRLRIGAPEGRGASGDFKVLPLDLVPAEGGLRYGVTGPEGQRRFVVEWAGGLAGAGESAVQVRASFAEDGSGVRYEYLKLPAGLTAAPGLSLRNGDGAVYDRQLEPAQGDRKQVAVQGTAFLFGELEGSKGIRLSCSGNGPMAFALPFAGVKAANQILHLGFRVFSPCEAGRCFDNLNVGYRLLSGDDEAVHPLAVARYELRDRGRSSQIDREVADTLDIAIPEALRGKDFALVLTPDAKAGRDRFLDLIWKGAVQTVYDVEERVHRTYDSTEPPYYVEEQPNRTALEFKPILDVTFNIAGRATDRSPTQASLDQSTCATAQDPENWVRGASGLAMRLRSGSRCSFSVSRPMPTSRFTAELWVRPGDPPRAQTILTVGNTLVSLDANRRVQCSASTGGTTLVGAATLPSDAWSHLAVSFDGAVGRCFVNGVLQGQFPAPLNLASAFDVQLGDGGQSDLDVDELRMIDTARPDSAILEDALRPLKLGAPKGNLLHLDFAHCGNAGCTQQVDQSKARNDATLTGAGAVPGVFGTVLATNTGQATVRVPHSDTLHLTDKMTAELWLKTQPSQAGAARLIGKWAGPISPGWRLGTTPRGRLRWEVVTQYTPPGGGIQIRRSVFISEERVNDAAWHHVAATYDGQRLRLFKDGLPLHRWCGSGPREGAMPDDESIENCIEPPRLVAECPPIETKPATDLPLLPGTTAKPILGDTECIKGVIDNQEPLLIANDGAGEALHGFVDEVRLSNYAKREFEVAVSARPLSAFSQVLGRETMVRNRFIWLDGRQVGPASNEAPYDLAFQPARDLRAFDAEGRLVSAVKHVLGQVSRDGYFQTRAAQDNMDRTGSIEYPHGEVAVNGFALDGTQTSLIGYGPEIGLTPAQSQAYVSSAGSTVTGKRADIDFGNGVRSAWTYDDGPVTTAMPQGLSGAFGPDELETATTKDASGILLSDRSYDWDVVGSLAHQNDAVPAGRGYAVDYTYDDLRRITSAKITGPIPSPPAPLDLFYSYDTLGNLRLIDGAKADGTLHPDDGARQDFGRRVSSSCPAATNSLPHAVTQRTVSAPTPLNELCYDAAGRILRSEDSQRNSINTFRYFARGKAKSITDRNGVSQYLYDGDGTRVNKIEPGLPAQVILGPIYREISSAGGLPSFEAMYALDSQSIVRRELSRASASDPLTTAPDGLVWFSLDHLGGTNFLTNDRGQEVANSRAYYRPFGAFLDRKNPPQTSYSGGRQFASMEIDQTGLYDFGARLYDPHLGRFTEADTHDVGMSPQAGNRFSYVFNDPLGMIDPSGNAPVDVIIGMAKEADSFEGDVVEHLPKSTSHIFDTASCHLNWGGCGGPTQRPRVTEYEFDPEPGLIDVPVIEFEEDVIQEDIKSQLRSVRTGKAIAEDAADESRGNATSSAIGALPAGNYGAAIYDFLRGDPSAGAMDLAEEGVDRTAGKLGILPPGAAELYNTYKLDRDMKAHKANVLRVRELRDREYQLMRELSDPKARVPIWDTRLHRGPDGQIYNSQGKRVPRIQE